MNFTPDALAQAGTFAETQARQATRLRTALLAPGFGGKSVDLRLPLSLYQLRQTPKIRAARQSELDQVAELLVRGERTQANSLLTTLEKEKR